MILSYKDLRKREVVNVVDGSCFDRITDLKLDFPRGNLKGIVVLDKKHSGCLGLFHKTEIFIDEKNILKIGGDVILVSVKSTDASTTETIDMSAKKRAPSNPPPPPCPSPHPSPCPPPPPSCPSPCPPRSAENEDFYVERIRVDSEDYF